MKLIDYTGKKFGRLTVLKELGHGRILCRCDCGTVREYNKSNVLRGMSTSCGCTRKHPRPDIQKNTVGRKFGRLTVLKELGYGKVLCQCDCGNQKIINKGHLLNGDILSCGCMLREQPEKAKAPFLVFGTNLSMIRSHRATARSKSGIRGVCYREDKHKWRASIGFRGEKYDLGYFDTKEEAAAARKEAEQRLYAPVIEAWNMKNKDK